MKTLLTTLIFTLTALAVPAQAETYEQATAALCEKVKQCAMQQIRTENMSGADERMMMDMMDNMCVGIKQNYAAAPNTPHYSHATACMRSMANLSCPEIGQMSDQNVTAECAAFNQGIQQ